MNLCLAQVLDSAALARVHARLAAAAYEEGAATAGWHARGVKSNLQTRDEAAALEIREALLRHPVFVAAALPRRLRAALFSRYLPGMAYGTHVDDALMGHQDPIRTDLAVTVFLSDPASYDGGELVIDGHSGIQAYKLAAGDAIVYPATQLHRVAEVTRGERLAAVLWVQSFVREPWQREILFDLDTARRGIWNQAAQRHTAEFDLLSKTYSNLLRAWADS
jgi:PKHD-type hydroxylase